MMYEATSGTASGEDSAFQSDFKVMLTAVIQRTTGIIAGISYLVNMILVVTLEMNKQTPALPT